jgi:hypothetical protein
MITIHPCTTSILAGKCRIACTITDTQSTRELWFEVDAKYENCLTTDSVDAFVVSSILPAMLLGHDLIVEGAMSKKLFYNLTHSVIPLLKQFLPCSYIIGIRPEKICGSFEQRGHGVMAGFSGGIDSFCNYYDHSGDRAPENIILHISFTTTWALMASVPQIVTTACLSSGLPFFKSSFTGKANHSLW